jgi:hypothetical protein
MIFVVVGIPIGFFDCATLRTTLTCIRGAYFNHHGANFVGFVSEHLPELKKRPRHVLKAL